MRCKSLELCFALKQSECFKHEQSNHLPSHRANFAIRATHESCACAAAEQSPPSDPISHYAFPLSQREVGLCSEHAFYTLLHKEHFCSRSLSPRCECVNARTDPLQFWEPNSASHNKKRNNNPAFLYRCVLGPGRPLGVSFFFFSQQIL